MSLDLNWLFEYQFISIHYQPEIGCENFKSQLHLYISKIIMNDSTLVRIRIRLKVHDIYIRIFKNHFNFALIENFNIINMIIRVYCQTLAGKRPCKCMLAQASLLPPIMNELQSSLHHYRHVQGIT